MTNKEQNRLQVLNGILEKRWTVAEAAKVLGVSERHTWRLLAAYRKEGAAALAHQNRGRVPANATPAEIRQQVVTLGRGRYADINHTQLTDLLAEREGVVLSRPTVRRLLLTAGLVSPRQRRPPRHRSRRQRLPQEGMLLQLDGSPHPWLEERGSWLTLLLAIDDATGTVPFALFQEQEDTRGYFQLLQGIIQERGVPLAVYTDRHAVFQSRGGGTERSSNEGQSARTQFGRALWELGVSQLWAHSPESKGRVERANGTFQDRLVVELRLAGASTLAEANRALADFLPRFNARFGVPPAQGGSAYRPLDPGVELAGVLCVKERRRVARDNTVQYHGRTLQLFPGVTRTSYAGARVEVQERLDGSLVVTHQGQVLNPQEAPPLAVQLRAALVASPVVTLPAPDPAEWQPQARPKAVVTPGPLAGATIWYEDPERKQTHRELVRAGMERARQQGKPVGRPAITQRTGFRESWAVMLERLERKEVSRCQAARELDIGYATLKRLLDARSPSPKQTTGEPSAPSISLPH